MVVVQYLFLSKVLETPTSVVLSRRECDALVLSKGQPGAQESWDSLTEPAFPPPLLFLRKQMSWKHLSSGVLLKERVSHLSEDPVLLPCLQPSLFLCVSRSVMSNSL